MALDHNPDREGHVPHKYIVINATKQPKKFIEAGGRRMNFSKEGFLSIKDPAVANDVRQKYGGEVTVSRVRSQPLGERGVHNYFFAMTKPMPWHRYDEFGRRIKE